MRGECDSTAARIGDGCTCYRQNGRDPGNCSGSDRHRSGDLSIFSQHRWHFCVALRLQIVVFPRKFTSPDHAEAPPISSSCSQNVVTSRGRLRLSSLINQGIRWLRIMTTATRSACIRGRDDRLRVRTACEQWLGRGLADRSSAAAPCSHAKNLSGVGRPQRVGRTKMDHPIPSRASLAPSSETPSRKAAGSSAATR